MHFKIMCTWTQEYRLTLYKTTNTYHTHKNNHEMGKHPDGHTLFLLQRTVNLAGYKTLPLLNPPGKAS